MIADQHRTVLFPDEGQHPADGAGCDPSLLGAVFARADVLAKDIQVQQSDEGLKLAQARFDVGMANFADVAQAKSALETFRAALVTSRANLLQSEGALRNMMGCPPSDANRLVPCTAPIKSASRSIGNTSSAWPNRSGPI